MPPRPNKNDLKQNPVRVILAGALDKKTIFFMTGCFLIHSAYQRAIEAMEYSDSDTTALLSSRISVNNTKSVLPTLAWLVFILSKKPSGEHSGYIHTVNSFKAVE